MIAAPAERRLQADEDFLEERVPPAGTAVIGVPHQADHEGLLGGQGAGGLVGQVADLACRPQDLLLVFAFTTSGLLNTRETVAGDTPHRRASSLIVATDQTLSHLAVTGFMQPVSPK
ncbi:hypothetical protein GCM10027612_73230 [Microbispora bryophytorum subsp. camponoti]